MSFALAFEVDLDVVLGVEEAAIIALALALSLALLTELCLEAVPEPTHWLAGKAAPYALGVCVLEVDGFGSFGFPHS